jgi:2-methylcitrate dehydratase PrpD
VGCEGPEHIGQGWHSGATLGVFSAAAGAARGLKLGADKTVHALGIAGTQAAGLMAAQYGAMVKRMHAGRASQSGLYGALFAQSGLLNPDAGANRRLRTTARRTVSSSPS